MRHHICQIKPVSAWLPLPIVILLVVTLSVSLSACVSSTLDTSVQQQPPAPKSQLMLSEEERRAEQLRNDAVSEIHAKAEAAPRNEEAPDYGVRRQGETTLLTPEEIAAKTAGIKANAGLVEEPDSETELMARKRRIDELLKKGRSHYQSAIKKIEKE